MSTSLLWLALRDNDVTHVRALLEVDREASRLLNDAQTHSLVRDHTTVRIALTPLQWACAHARHEAVEALLDAGADPNASPSGDAYTPLALAAFVGDTDSVMHLLAHGADVHRGSRSTPPILMSTSPLRIAVTRGHARVVTALAAGGACVNAYTADGVGAAAAAAAAPGGRVRVTASLPPPAAAAAAASLYGDLVTVCADVPTRAGDSMLYLAADLGHARVVAALLAAGARVAAGDRSPALVAAAHGDTSVVHTLLRACGRTAVAAWDTPRGVTPLQAAVWARHEETARALLDVEAVTWAADAAATAAADATQLPARRHPLGALVIALETLNLRMFDLIMAACPRHLVATAFGTLSPYLSRLSDDECVHVLTSLVCRGMDVCGRDAELRVPLHRAAGEGHVNAILYLAQVMRDAGVSVDGRSAAGRTPLHEAARAGHARACDALIECGADCEARDQDGATPLHLAIKFRHVSTMVTLLARGAEVDAASLTEAMALRTPCDPCVTLCPTSSAAQDPFTCLVRAASSAVIRAVRVSGIPLLHLLVRVGDARVRELMLKVDGNQINMAVTPAQSSACRGTPLDVALRHNQVDMVRVLTTSPHIAVNYRAPGGGVPPLHAALMSTVPVEMVDLLLRVPGVDPNIRNEWGGTPLHVAVLIGATRVVSTLKERPGVAMNAVIPHTRHTPLHLAVVLGRSDIARILLSPTPCTGGMVDVNATDSDGNGPLHMAATRCDTDAALLLLSTLGVNPDVPNMYGETPLHVAIKNGCATIVQALLACKLPLVDVNARTLGGATPLHMALDQRAHDVIRLLVNTGRVNLSLEDERTHERPLQKAVRLGVPPHIISAMLRRSGCGHLTFDAACPTWRRKLLHTAVERGDIVLLTDLLTSFRGRPTALKDRNERGETPCMLAERLGHTAIADMLKNIETTPPSVSVLNWYRAHVATHDVHSSEYVCLATLISDGVLPRASLPSGVHRLKLLYIVMDLLAKQHDAGHPLQLTSACVYLKKSTKGGTYAGVVLKRVAGEEARATATAAPVGPPPPPTTTKRATEFGWVSSSCGPVDVRHARASAPPLVTLLDGKPVATVAPKLAIDMAGWADMVVLLLQSTPVHTTPSDTLAPPPPPPPPLQPSRPEVGSRRTFAAAMHGSGVVVTLPPPPPPPPKRRCMGGGAPPPLVHGGAPPPVTTTAGTGAGAASSQGHPPTLTPYRPHDERVWVTDIPRDVLRDVLSLADACSRDTDAEKRPCASAVAHRMYHLYERARDAGSQQQAQPAPPPKASTSTTSSPRAVNTTTPCGG